MHPLVVLISSLSLMVYFLAVWRGGGPERVAGALLLAVFVVDEIRAVLFGRTAYLVFEPLLLAANVTELAVFTWLAIKANRLWPVVAAAMKLVSLLAHLFALTMSIGMTQAYFVMVELPGVLTIIALAFGTFAHWRRQRRIGPYPDWRADFVPT